MNDRKLIVSSFHFDVPNLVLTWINYVAKNVNFTIVVDYVT